MRRSITLLLCLLLCAAMGIDANAGAVFADKAMGTGGAEIKKTADPVEESSGNNTAELTEPEKVLPAADLAFNGSYISKHYNEKYVNQVDPAAFGTPVTYARSNAAYTRKGGNKLTDGKDQSNVIAAMNYYTLIYDVDPDSSYYAALPDVNMGSGGFRPYAVDVVYNNNANQLLDDVYYDEETSILYISKKYYTDPKPDAALFDDAAATAIQVSYRMPEEYTEDALPDYGKNLPVIAFTSGKSKKYVYKDVKVNNIFDVTTLLPCMVEDPSLYKADDFVITLNGTFAPLSADAGQYTYDPDTGEITIADSAAAMSSVTVMINEKGLSDKAKKAVSNAFGDLYAHAADIIEHEDMKALKYDGKYIYIQDDESGNLYKNMYLGWRGYYDNNDVSGDSIRYDINTRKLIASCGDFFENSIKYLHAASSKSASWALVSYAQGSDATLKPTDEDVVSGRNTDREIPSRDDVRKYGGIDGKKTFYEWMVYYRQHLLNYEAPGKENGSSNNYWDNGGTQLQYQNSKGQDNGAVTFAFQFPENITGAPNFVDDAHRVEGKNTGKIDMTIKSDNLDMDRKDLWLAGWCRHFYDGKDGQNRSKTVYVSCIGKGVESKTDRKYVILSFASDGAFSYKKKNGKLGWQTGGAVYKLYVGKVDEKDGKFQIYKDAKDGTDPTGEYSMAGAVFKVYDKSGKLAATMPVTKYIASRKCWETDVVTLKEGNYTVRETTAPANGKWAIDKNSYAFEIDADKNGEEPLLKHFSESKTNTSGYLRIRKMPEAAAGDVDISPGGDYSMEGATYAVTDKATGKAVSGSPFAAKWQKDPEDSTKKVWITDLIELKYGTYTIKEKRAPLSGRWTIDKTAHDVTINSSHVENEKIFKHTEQSIDPGLLVIEKVPEQGVDPEDLRPGGRFSMKGARYAVMDDEGELVGRYQVGWDADDKVWRTEEIELDYGTYTVKEERAPANGAWLLDTSWNKSVTINSSHVTNAFVQKHTEQVRKGSLKIKKKPKDPPAGFVPDGTFYSLKGAVYEIYDAAGTKAGELTTDDNGETPVLDNLIPGTYTVKEKNASEGFLVQVPDAQTVEIAPEDTKVFESSEPLVYGYLNLQKVSSQPENTDGNDNYSYQNATYFVYDKNDTKVATLVTDGNGKSNTVKLLLGKYTVKEQTASKGYKPGADITVELTKAYKTETAPLTSQSKEPPQFGRIRFDKAAKYAFDSTGRIQPEENSTFVIWNNSVTKTKEAAKAKGSRYYQEITAKNGMVWTDLLALGTYTIEQTDVGRYRDFIKPMAPVTVTLVPEKWVDLNGHVADTAERLTSSGRMNDHPSRVRLLLRKQSDDYVLGHFGLSDFQKDTTATFQVESVDTDGTEDADALTVAGYQETVTTGADGTAALKGPKGDGFIPTGKYRITETSVTPGFYNNPATSVREVLVDTSGKVKDISAIDHDDAGKTAFKAEAGKPDHDGTKVYELTWTKRDTPQYTKLKVNKARKFINEFGNAESKPQPGVEFALYAAGDITSYDGDENHVYYKDGTLIQGMIIDPQTGTRSYFLDGKEIKDPTEEQQKKIRIITDSKGQWDCGETSYPLTNNDYPKGTQSRYMMKEMYIWEKGDHISFTDAQKEALIKIWEENGFQKDAALEEAGGMTFQQILNFGIDIVARDVQDDNGASSKKGYASNGSYITGVGDTGTHPTYKFLTSRITKFIDGSVGDQDIVNDNDETVGHLDTGQEVLSPSEAADLVAATDHVGPVESDKAGTEFTFSFINDQTPSVRTTAYLEGDRKKIPNEGKIAFRDKVEYKNLIPGVSYTLEATLYDKATGLAVNSDAGVPVKATRSFTPGTRHGEVTVEFPETDASLFEGDTVVFETLKEDGTVVADHKDINDDDQTVEHVPYIRTTATSGGAKSVAAEGKVTITDTVTYRGLKAGQTYTLKGVLMNKSTETAVMEGDHEVASEKTFTADESGQVSLDFVFDASGLADMDVVVFEKVYGNGGEHTEDTQPLAVHEDFGDRDQTVRIAPEFSTTATDQASDTHTATISETTTLTDVVEYKGLEKGSYTMTGVLMDKATGKPLEINGAPVAKTQPFEVTKPDGKVSLAFELNTTAGELSGKSLVVFEEGYNEAGILIGFHKDLDDENQTVRIPESKEEPPVEEPPAEEPPSEEPGDQNEPAQDNPDQPQVTEEEKPSEKEETDKKNVVTKKQEVINKTEITEEKEQPETVAKKRTTEKKGKKSRKTSGGVDTGDATDPVLYLLGLTFAAALLTVLILLRLTKKDHIS